MTRVQFLLERSACLPMGISNRARFRLTLEDDARIKTAHNMFKAPVLRLEGGAYSGGQE